MNKREEKKKEKDKDKEDSCSEQQSPRKVGLATKEL